jgi:hypothetical protein
MLKNNYLNQYLVMLVWLLSNTNICNGVLTNETTTTPIVTALSTTLTTPTTTSKTLTTFSTISTTTYKTDQPYKMVDNKCTDSSYCFPLIMVVSIVFTLVIMIYACQYCINKATLKDKREERLENTPVRYVINDLYELNTEDNNQYYEI